MVRTSPCYYIAPTAISISPNANGSANDLAVNVVKGTKIKVYSLGISALGYSDTTFQQWTLTGRNRRLADNSKPYSIYARLAKTNKEDGYLVFAPKVADGDKWLDKYAYVTIGGLATGTANKNSDDYWYIKLGEVSLPVDNTRNVTLDTGILGTDRFNTEWNIDPDQMPLRIELSATIESKDAGDRPYVEWGKRLVLQAKLLEGWANANVQRFSHFTIQRNTGNASADTAYNYPDEKSDSENPSSGRKMPNGSIDLSHARGTGDVFNGTVSSIWTVIAWGLKANVADSTSSSSSTSGTVTANVYEKLAEKSINIMAETGEQYALEMSSSVVNYDPSSKTYNPKNGIDVMVRATDQRGKVFKLTNAQLRAANLFVQYSLEHPEIWSDCDFKGDATVVAKANIPIKVFEAQKNVNVRIAKAHYLEIYRSHIAFIRSGEDGSAYDIYLSASVLKGDSTGKLNGNDTVSVTAKVVKITGGTAVQVTDTNEAYFTISRTDDRGDLTDWPSGSFTVKTFEAFGQGVKTWNFALYVGGTFLKTVMLPVVRDGKQGADGSAATVYTIETVGNYNNNSGKLVDASTIGVTLTGDLKLYKTVGNEKTEDSKPPQCWRLTVGGENIDGTRVFDNNAGNNIVTYEYYNEYNIDSNGNSTAPGSATISVYRDSSMSELLASLVVPISLNPGAIVNVDAKLGKIESTTTSMKGTIETIKQGQGQISLKVQGLERKSRNILSGGNVIGLFNKQYEVFRSLPFVMEKGRTYTVTARLWMESNSNERHVKAFVFGSDNNWTYAYSSAYFTKTSADYLRFKFEAGVTRQMVVAFYEQNSSGDNPGSGNYNGVHVDWVRVDEGDWTGVDANGRTLDKWEPSEEETNAVNLLPNPAFSASIGYTDGMGERNTFVGSMGDAVPWMSRDSSADGDGCRGVTFERSGYSDPNGTNPNSYGGLRYIVPFRGAGTYCISFVYTDLSQTLSGKPDMDKVVVMELHPCDADKYRITAGINTGGMNVSSAKSGIIRAQTYKTFGETATDNSGKVKKIAYLEVRVFLWGNGSVRVSRLCLSKSDHFIYWNANDVSEARKKEAALFATGIDIDSMTVTMTGRNFVWQDNAGVKVAYMDDKGNATFNGVINASGGKFTGTVTGATINGSTINSTSADKNSVTTIEGGQITTNNITAKGGQISFFYFDAEGMASAVEYDSSQNKPWRGMGLSSDNISVSGYTGQRISSVFLGKGLIDSRFAGSDKNYIVHRVGTTSSASTFYNYIKLERFKDGHDSYENDPEYAALGIETQGDFCLAALGGPSLFAGMCFASNTGGSFTADKRHCFYLCSGGTFYMPSDPPDGMLIVVIQTGSRINFNGNKHRFRCGTNYSESCNSNSVGQWNLFYYDGGSWNAIYMNGRPW